MFPSLDVVIVYARHVCASRLHKILDHVNKKRDRFRIKAALVVVFQALEFEERALTVAHRRLARHVHPDKAKPILDALYGEDGAAPFARTFQRLQSAYDDAHALLFASRPDYVDPPSNVYSYFTSTENSTSLWITMDAAASDKISNEYGDPVSWVQIEIPDGTGVQVKPCRASLFKLAHWIERRAVFA